MTDSFIRIPPDSTGKKVRTNEVTVGADDVQQHCVTLYAPDGTAVDWGGYETGAMGVYVIGEKSGGGYKTIRNELNPTTGEYGLNVNAMPGAYAHKVKGQNTQNNTVTTDYLPVLPATAWEVDAQRFNEGKQSTLRTALNGDVYARVAQNVVADANNSSTTNLAAGNTYTFTGSKTSTLGVAGIQVSLYADKNCIVRVQQSPDSTPHWDLTDTYYYTASSNFGVTVQAISSYVRVVVTTASETTTTFRLQTALCPIVEAVPRSLDGNGNFKIANPVDNYGWGAENTPFGELRAISPTRLVGTTFDGSTIDGIFWTTAAAGTSAAVAQGNSQLLITSGTSNAATVTAFTVRRARYVGGIGIRYRAVVQADAGVADNVRRWGIGWGSAAMPTVTDGAWFMLDGTAFKIQTMKGGSAATVTTFNGQLGPTYDPGTTVHTYEIYWTNSKVYFVVGDTLLHTVSASTATWANTMNFHAFMDSVNSGVLGASVTLATRVATIHRLGNLLTQPQYYYFASGTTAGVQLKIGAGNLHQLIINNIVNNSVLTLADSTSAGTPAIFVHTAGATSTGVVSIDFDGIPFANGLRLIVATQNASVTVIYE